MIRFSLIIEEAEKTKLCRLITISGEWRKSKQLIENLIEIRRIKKKCQLQKKADNREGNGNWFTLWCPFEFFLYFKLSFFSTENKRVNHMKLISNRPFSDWSIQLRGRQKILKHMNKLTVYRCINCNIVLCC